MIRFSEEPDNEVLRLDKQGFHYRGELIEDAGEAHRLMVTFLQRHTSMHPEVVEKEVDWRELCAKLLAALERPQRPPADLIQKVRDALELTKEPDVDEHGYPHELGDFYAS